MKLLGKERDPKTGDEFFVYENVPIFDEHEDCDGVRYDYRLLSQIAQNNNDRIEDTGDLVPIVEHHTDDANDPKTDPEIFGYAGPFNVQRFGKKKPRWAIYARRWKIRAEKHDEAKLRPRRSVEIWPEDSPEDRYFDPIALLGAETPRRDLGILRYEKTGDKTRKIRYSIPSGSNTFVPNGTAGDDQPNRNAKGPTMAGSMAPEQLTQIIEAMKPVIEQIVAEQIDMANPPGTDNLGSDGSYPGGLGDDQMPMEDTLAPAGGLGGLGADMGAGPTEGGPPPAPGGDADPMAEDDEDDEFGKAAAGQFRKRFMKNGALDKDSAIQYMDSMDDGDYEAVEKYMKSTGCDDEELKQNFAKCCRGRDVSMPDADGMKKGAAKYRKDRNEIANKYQKACHELAGVKRRYAKAQETIAEMKAEATEQASKLRYEKRKAHLNEIRQEGYVLDPVEEMDGGCATMTDEQFDRHIDHVVRKRYQKVPIENVPGLDAAIAGDPKQYARKTDGDKSARYAKAAASAVITQRKLGNDVDYRTVLNHMVSKDTDKFEPQPA